MSPTAAPGPSGLLVVDKPAAMTSHDVVARVRRLAGTRKVGHAGTLDPMATGVLVLGLNRATRLLGHLMLTDKEYAATVRLGESTTTDDADGETTATTGTAALTETEIRTAAGRFVGELEQVPSAVSAIKVEGRRAYDRVRAGEDVTLAPRRVNVHGLRVDDVRRSGAFVDLDIVVRCSSGTYVRAIARDLGAALRVGGHLTSLRRTAVGGLTIQEAHPLAAMEESGRVELTPMGVVAERHFPSVRVEDAAARDIGFGRRLRLTLPDQARPVAMLDGAGELLALYEQRGELAVPVAVFTG